MFGRYFSNVRINTTYFVACTAGTFGSQCLEDCHCRNVSFPCNHVHGTCPEGGCQRGYKGGSCTIGKESAWLLLNIKWAVYQLKMLHEHVPKL